MQTKYANRDELAWEKGELAYSVGDTMELAVKKATNAGFRPGSNGYAAFITAFSRKVRNRSVQGETQARSNIDANLHAIALVSKSEQHPKN